MKLLSHLSPDGAGLPLPGDARLLALGKAAAVALFMSLFGLVAACVYVWMSRESLKR